MRTVRAELPHCRRSSDARGRFVEFIEFIGLRTAGIAQASPVQRMWVPWGSMERRSRGMCRDKRGALRGSQDLESGSRRRRGDLQAHGRACVLARLRSAGPTQAISGIDLLEHCRGILSAIEQGVRPVLFSSPRVPPRRRRASCTSLGIRPTSPSRTSTRSMPRSTLSPSRSRGSSRI